jgi:hypothetical protein
MRERRHARRNGLASDVGAWDAFAGSGLRAPVDSDDDAFRSRALPASVMVYAKRTAS